MANACSWKQPVCNDKSRIKIQRKAGLRYACSCMNRADVCLCGSSKAKILESLICHKLVHYLTPFPSDSRWASPYPGLLCTRHDLLPSLAWQRLRNGINQPLNLLDPMQVFIMQITTGLQHCNVKPVIRSQCLATNAVCPHNMMQLSGLYFLDQGSISTGSFESSNMWFVGNARCNFTQNTYQIKITSMLIF